MRQDDTFQTEESDEESIILIKQQLDSGVKWLEFPTKLEKEFTEHLAVSQRWYAIVTCWIGLALWLTFLVIDIVRYRSLGEKHPDTIDVFIYWIFLPRLTGLLALVVGISIFYWKRWRSAWASPIIIAVILCTEMVIVTTTSTYQNMYVPTATSAQILVLVAAFAPIGLRFSHSVKLGCALVICSLAMGLMILNSVHIESHMIMISIMCAALLLSAVSAYMREHSMRTQFLLRKLDRWHANHDALTGLFNRYKLDENVHTHIKQAQRERVGLSFAIIDIDHFKDYNDFYGHQAGDEALIKVARLIRNYARKPLDVVVRLGGEEFAILTYNENADSLHARLTKLQNELHTLAIPHAQSQTSAYLTISIGIAQLNTDITNLDKLYKTADEALYISKNTGRDRITIAN